MRVSVAYKNSRKLVVFGKPVPIYEILIDITEKLSINVKPKYSSCIQLTIRTLTHNIGIVKQKGTLTINMVEPASRGGIYLQSTTSCGPLGPSSLQAIGAEAMQLQVVQI